MSVVTASFPIQRPYDSIGFSVVLVQQPLSAEMRTLLPPELEVVSGSGFWSTVSKLLLGAGAGLMAAGTLGAGAVVMVLGAAVDDWWQDALR